MRLDGEHLDELLLVERVLSRCMRDGDAMERMVRAGVGEAEFDVVEHKAVVRAMVGSYGQHNTADVALVEERLRRDGWEPPKARKWLDAIANGGGRYPLDDAALSACLDRLRHLAALRRVRTLADRMRSMADADRAPSEIAAEVSQEVEAIVAGSASRRIQTGRALAERFSRRLTEGVKVVERIPTGIPFVDRALRGGVRRGLVLIFGATLGAGKSTFGYHMLLSALTVGPAAYFSLEIGADPFFDGLVETAAQRRIELNMGPDSWSGLIGAAGDPRIERLFVDDGNGAGMTAEEIAAKIHQLARNGVKSVFVDYAQDVEPSTRHPRPDMNFAHVSKVLRRAADRYHVALFEMVQMAAPDDRAKKPAPQSEEHVADTRQFAKDASYAVILDRLKHSTDPIERNLNRIRVTKNRPEKDLCEGWMRYDTATTELYHCDARGDRALTVDVGRPADIVDEWTAALNEAESQDAP